MRTSVDERCKFMAAQRPAHIQPGLSHHAWRRGISVSTRGETIGMQPHHTPFQFLEGYPLVDTLEFCARAVQNLEPVRSLVAVGLVSGPPFLHFEQTPCPRIESEPWLLRASCSIVILPSPLYEFPYQPRRSTFPTRAADGLPESMCLMCDLQAAIGNWQARQDHMEATEQLQESSSFGCACVVDFSSVFRCNSCDRSE